MLPVSNSAFQWQEWAVWMQPGTNSWGRKLDLNEENHVSLDPDCYCFFSLLNLFKVVLKAKTPPSYDLYLFLSGITVTFLKPDCRQMKERRSK